MYFRQPYEKVRNCKSTEYKPKHITKPLKTRKVLLETSDTATPATTIHFIFKCEFTVKLHLNLYIWASINVNSYNRWLQS